MKELNSENLIYSFLKSEFLVIKLLKKNKKYLCLTILYQSHVFHKKNKINTYDKKNKNKE